MSYFFMLQCWLRGPMSTAIDILQGHIVEKRWGLPIYIPLHVSLIFFHIFLKSLTDTVKLLFNCRVSGQGGNQTKSLINLCG